MIAVEPEKARRIAEARCTERLARVYGGMFSLEEWLICVDVEEGNLEATSRGEGGG